MRFLIICLFAALSLARPALAFDYLEHSYFSDRACLYAQDRLAERIVRDGGSPGLLRRYAALAIACPNRWDGGYCGENGYKRHEGNINRLEEPGEGVSLTLGDIAALPDHISDFGPVRNLTSPDQGLAANVLQWLAASPSPIGGIIGDVSEDACEDPVDWERVEQGLALELKNPRQAAAQRNFSPLDRAPVQRGPADPAGLYSFDNPHFLDLVLRDSHHFGDHAFGSWTGFHGAATDVAARPCEQVVPLEEDIFSALADDAATQSGGWDELDAGDRARQICSLAAGRLAQRLQEWSRRAPQPLVTPLQPYLRELSKHPDPHLVSALLGLVFEGSGLHFLEDGLSAGHMRASEGRRGLGERRYDHDYDNRTGVSAAYPTAQGPVRFVAFGDTYMLGPAYAPATDCSSAPTPELVSDCLVQHHRGIVIQAAGASLLDWALGGPMYAETPAEACRGADPEMAAVCAHLPLQAAKVSGHGVAPPPVQGLRPGSLPIVAPPFGYESLDIEVANDLRGAANQLGVSMAYYSALGASAGWLTSYRIGFRTVESANTFQGDFAYGFHWRWAARFLVDMEPFVFAGLTGPASGRRFETGIGPRAGITALPEGWVKIPLELGVSYRLPIVMYGRKGGIGIEGHWLLLSLGLAFM